MLSESPMTVQGITALLFHAFSQGRSKLRPPFGRPVMRVRFEDIVLFSNGFRSDNEPVGLAGPVLLQLPVRAPGGRRLRLQPRLLQPGLPAAGRPLHAAAATPRPKAQEEAQGRGIYPPF